MPGSAHFLGTTLTSLLPSVQRGRSVFLLPSLVADGTSDFVDGCGEALKNDSQSQLKRIRNAGHYLLYPNSDIRRRMVIRNA